MSANRGAKITLAWLEASRAQRIVWLFEELGLSYNLQTYKRVNQRAPPEMKNIHPLGKSPIVTIEYPENQQPIVLAESAAIMEHLIDNFDGERLLPQRYSSGTGTSKFGTETESWRRYRFYMHYAEGSLMSLLFTKILMDAIKAAPVPFFVKPVTKLISNKVSQEYLQGNFKTHFDFLENQLASSPESGDFLCGKDLTAADIIMSFPTLIAFDQKLVDKERYPRLAAYVGRLQAMDGYKRSIRKVEEVEGRTYQLL